jgi:hypothetical protein
MQTQNTAQTLPGLALFFSPSRVRKARPARHALGLKPWPSRRCTVAVQHAKNAVRANAVQRWEFGLTNWLPW